jgi:GNAT superfamily N-acetyltransferase
VHRGAHAGVLRRRAEWFEALGEPFAVLWWIPVEHVPTIEEGKSRLERLRRLGPTPEAFTFDRLFPPACPSLVILDYAPAYRRDWEALNLAWLEKYFTVEEVDRKILADPEREMLDGGGHVLLAALEGTIVGTCGLRRLDGETFELVKMAVAEGCQGRGIGTALGSAAIARARMAGAQKVVLETNSRLAAALHVYRKLGFKPAPAHAGSTYARTDTALELEL